MKPETAYRLAAFMGVAWAVGSMPDQRREPDYDTDALRDDNERISAAEKKRQRRMKRNKRLARRMEDGNE